MRLYRPHSPIRRCDDTEKCAEMVTPSFGEFYLHIRPPKSDRSTKSPVANVTKPTPVVRGRPVTIPTTVSTKPARMQGSLAMRRSYRACDKQRDKREPPDVPPFAMISYCTAPSVLP